MIKIGTALHLYNKGKRTRQEDSIISSINNKNVYVNNDFEYFIVCDGMGGHEHGDVASKIVTNSMNRYFLDTQGSINRGDIISAFDHAYDILDYYGDNLGLKNMGTTIAALFISENKYFACHIGDSRIYHIRSNSSSNRESTHIVYKSWDHTMVNMLVKTGQIAPEEAYLNPQRNVLLKVMKPCMGDNRSLPFIFEGTDLCSGDYFFLCSDGVTGYLDDEILLSIITDKSMDDNQKIDKIDELCNELSDDNYSCWLISIL